MDKIQLLSIEQIKPYENNPKAHTDEQIAEIVKSIKAFGFDQPIVVDQNYEIIKGHGRRLAAIEIGLAEVPVIVRDDIDQNTAKLLRVLDNKLQSRTWEDQALRSELLELKDRGYLGLTGFGDKDIPVGRTMGAVGGVSDFKLDTHHQCPSCQYK